MSNTSRPGAEARIRLISAKERLAESTASIALFGRAKIGKTTTVIGLPGKETVVLDLEAGMKAVEGRYVGDSIAIRSFPDAINVVCLLAGPDPAKGWKITKSLMRAMIDSALALDPADMSDAAKEKRNLRGFRDLDGIEFFAKIGIKPGDPTPDGGVYPDRNIITRVIEPNEPQWAEIRAGKIPPPAPSLRRATPAAAPAAAPATPKPAWQQETPATAAQPATPQGPAWLRGEK